MSATNALQVHEFLRGLDYPADRAELLRVARRNEAEETVLAALDALPDRVFATAPELTKALGGSLPPSGAGSGPRGASGAGDDLGTHPARPVEEG